MYSKKFVRFWFKFIFGNTCRIDVKKQKQNNEYKVSLITWWNKQSTHLRVILCDKKLITFLFDCLRMKTSRLKSIQFEYFAQIGYETKCKKHTPAD